MHIVKLKMKSAMIAIALICLCVCRGDVAAAANYTVSKCSVNGVTHHAWGNGCIYSEGESIVDLDYSFKKKNGKYTTEITKTVLADNGEKKSIRVKGKEYPIEEKNSILYTYSSLDNKTIQISAYNWKGKLKNQYNIKVDKVNYKKISDITIDTVAVRGSKVYYVLENMRKRNYVYIQCYDTKEKHVTHNRKVKDTNSNYYTFQSNRLYSFNVRKSSEIIVRNLSGKKINQYYMPSTSSDSRNLYGVDVKGDKIYCANDNGVYVCDTAKGKEFEIIFDGTGSELFSLFGANGWYLDNFEVTDNESFYMFWGDDEDAEHERYFFEAIE